MESLSPLALAAIGFIIFIVVGVNVWMIALLKSKDLREMQLKMRPPRQNQSANNMKKFVKLLRNPWMDEDEDLARLSKLVDNLKDQERK
jgi:hypothetical protein